MRISLLILVLFFQTSSFAKNPIHEQKPKSSCEVCEKVAKFKSAAETNETKAANEFANYISNVKLSKDLKLRKQELQSVVSLAGVLLHKDTRLEICQYLVSFRDDDTKMFDEIVAEQPADIKKALIENDKKMRDFIKNGEKDSP